jgi:tRNA(fMet)-specific endonuclease VapC
MYLLDTNACIALIKNTTPSVRDRFEKAVAADQKVLVPAIVGFELWYGVGKSAREESNARLVETFLAGPVSLLPFEFEDAKVAGRVRASLESAGKPIGAYDVLIAGQALRHQLILVTANVREFSRIKGLAWQDWAKG